MAKLSDAQIKVLESVHTGNTLPKGTRQTTVDILETKENMIYLDQGVWRLTEIGSAAIGVEHKRSPNEILPGETAEVTGSYAGGHSQEQILELLGEEVQESDEVTHVLDSDGILKTSPLGEHVEAPTIPFFNRKALRDLRRQQARYNRRMMREQGKRRRKYGADDPQYFRRRYLRMLADTSELDAA